MRDAPAVHVAQPPGPFRVLREVSTFLIQTPVDLSGLQRPVTDGYRCIPLCRSTLAGDYGRKWLGEIRE